MQNSDVKKLIADWETANRVISPASDLLTVETVNPTLAQLSFLSSRQEYWDCAVCAVGFADAHALSANEVLTQIAEDVRGPVTGDQTRDFLDYCSGVSSLSEEALSLAASVIVAGLGSMNVDPKLLMDIETCFDMCQDDEKCITDCLAANIRPYEKSR